MTVGPETLRMLVEKLRRWELGGAPAFVLLDELDSLDAHADAWEQDLTDKATLHQRLDALAIAADALRSIPAARQALGTNHVGGCTCGLCAVNALLAADSASHPVEGPREDMP